MHVRILGTRGIPAQHGGFETFADDLARYLVSRKHRVTVYGQTDVGSSFSRSVWEGIELIRFPVEHGPLGTIKFDWAATLHASKEKDVVLTLGYNTGVFNLVHWLKGVPNVMNMDGIEWKREKWSRAQRLWLWLNEWGGARVAHHLVADHPEIANHLARHTRRSKITVIPYGADAVVDAPEILVRNFGLEPNGYYIVIARPEPENSLLEVVRAYSRKRRKWPLVVLGKYLTDHPYHAHILSEASDQVRFLGTVYERDSVRALRFYAQAYFHGHRVGGTNPSLVEALAAGNAVVAHDNRFNRWVAGEGARYFTQENDINRILDAIEGNDSIIQAMKIASRTRHAEAFTQEQVLSEYEQLLLKFA